MEKTGEQKIIRVCNECGQECQALIESEHHSKTTYPDGRVIIEKMGDYLVSDCCKGDYLIWSDIDGEESCIDIKEK